MSYMRRVEVIAKGDVLRVGFRNQVHKIARKLGICGTVRNQEPYDVKIVAEGQEALLEEFLRSLRVQKPPILVEDLSVQWMDATGEFPYFMIVRGDWQDELAERFDVAVELLYRSVDLGEKNLMVGQEMLKRQDKTIELQIEMIKRQDKMLDMQIEMIKRQDKMLDMQQDTRDRQEETVVEIRGMRSDLHEYMDRRFSRIEDEIGEIKRAIKEMGGSC